MLRPYLLAAVLTLAGMTPAFGYTEITQEQFLYDTGVGCIVGGIALGATALMVGPATVTTALASEVMVPTSVSTGLLGMFGCGAGATVSMVMYARKWVYDALFTEMPYPLLYPTPEELLPTPQPAAESLQPAPATPDAPK